jgi:hypothetical protein
MTCSLGLLSLLAGLAIDVDLSPFPVGHLERLDFLQCGQGPVDILSGSSLTAIS